MNLLFSCWKQMIRCLYVTLNIKITIYYCTISKTMNLKINSMIFFYIDKLSNIKMHKILNIAE